MNFKKKQKQNQEEKEDRIIIILQKACLRTIKVKDKYELLNHDDHHRIISQSKEKLSARPDILYQTLITLQDSPLNKAGKLQIYIHTETNVLIQVNPKLHVPRTFHRFKKLMVQLLKNLTIRSTNNSEILLKVIKNPVTKYLPTGCPIIGCSHSSDSLIDLHEFVPKLPKGPIIFILGAMAHGAIDTSYSETTISFSQFPLSASVACGKICFAFEHLWEIL
ncbi:nep1/mra1 [Anaeramoeba flamelloides]|uniref:Nep1/mra1 n=1 Tax=Anaeramoeba flamelloides TaxID=1746091 RepID=A0AAV7Z862_9EUKA|nr:nep1/mra1 [Anaeramoeba flamelloides]KAJ6244604.1 nep1/mra1 [Anaeramoeba flamelloides]